MKKSFKRGELIEVGGVTYTPIRHTATMPPGPEWVPSVTPNYLPELPSAIDGAAGRDGERGADGRDGIDGKDGADAPPLVLAGEYRRGKTYAPLSVVTHEGSSYIAKVETSKEPPGKSWQLLAEKGDAGERGEDGSAGGRGPRGLPGETNAASSQLNMVSVDGVKAGMVVRATHMGNHVVRASSLGAFPAYDVIGLAAQTAKPGHAVKVAIDRLVLKDWSEALQSGSSVLEPGRGYYLSRTLGKLVGSGPQTGTMLYVGLAISETTLLLEVRGIVQWNKPVLATLNSTGVKGQFVSVAENGRIDLALPIDPWPLYAVVGTLRADCNAGDEASVHIGGDCLTLPDWSGVTEDGASMLVENGEYWLSMSAPGKITNVKPIESFSIGRAKSPTKLDVWVGKTRFSIGVNKDCC